MGEVAEEAGLLRLLPALLSGDVGLARCAEGEGLSRSFFISSCGGGGGGRSSAEAGGGGRSSICAASFCSVAFRSATRSAMRASKSLSSSS